MKLLYSVYDRYYKQRGKGAIDFLRDAVGYLNSRNETLNQNQTIFQLLLEWCRRVEFNNHTRY